MPRGIYALCDDGHRVELSLRRKAQLLLEGGAGTIQLRLKQTTGEAALAAARTVVAACRARGAICIVNDRVDLALLAEADGAHVGAEDLTPADARRLLGPHRILGVTVRNLEEAVVAQQGGANYVGLGPIFSTSTKAVGVPPIGLAGLEAVVEALALPVVAIAGIGLGNVESVAAAGAHAAAVLSDPFSVEEVAARTRELVRAFERGARPRSLG